MKKLMIAAAAVAMTAGAYAGTGAHAVGYAYDMVMNVRTTWCNTKGYTMAKFKDETLNGFVYRVQYSLKLQGAFWGCGCDVIGAPTFYSSYYSKDDGFLFWSNSTTELFVNEAEETYELLPQMFKWEALNVYGKNADQVEGLFRFQVGEDGAERAIVIEGAGYGSASVPYPVLSTAEGRSEEEVPLSDWNYIKVMKGFCVGMYVPGAVSGAIGCYYCGQEVNCDAYRFCDCENCAEAATTKVAPLFGTFTLKVNASATKKIRAGQTIWKADSKIPSKIKAALLALEKQDPS